MKKKRMNPVLLTLIAATLIVGGYAMGYDQGWAKAAEMLQK